MLLLFTVEGSGRRVRAGRGRCSWLRGWEVARREGRSPPASDLRLQKREGTTESCHRLLPSSWGPQTLRPKPRKRKTVRRWKGSKSAHFYCSPGWGASDTRGHCAHPCSAHDIRGAQVFPRYSTKLTGSQKPGLHASRTDADAGFTLSIRVLGTGRLFLSGQGEPRT